MSHNDNGRTDHSVHSLGNGYSPFSMLSVGDRVPDNILEEDLEHTSGLFVYKT
jgi:hypothetical protein